MSSTAAQQPTPPEADKVEAAKIQREREQRERSTAIQQIYMHKKYGKPITNERAKAMMPTPRKVKKKGSVEKQQEEPPDLNKELDEVRADRDKTFDEFKNEVNKQMMDLKVKTNKFIQEAAKYTSTTLQSSKQSRRQSSLTTPTRTRARALNALLFGDSNPFKMPSPQEQTKAHELPPYYMNAILDKTTGEVNIPANKHNYRSSHR